MQGGPHGAQIRAKVDDVGHQQEQDNAQQKRTGVMAADIGGDTPPGHAANLRGHFLNDDHQGKAEDKCPSQAIAKFRPDLTVRANA